MSTPISPLKPQEIEQLKSLKVSADVFSSTAPKLPAASLPKEKSTSKKAPSQAGKFYAGMQRQKPTAASAKSVWDMAHRKVMVRWQKHKERLDEARSHYQRGGREIVIGAAAVAEAERATIMGPVDRAAALKCMAFQRRAATPSTLCTQ
jgi:hypothetical protein